MSRSPVLARSPRLSYSIGFAVVLLALLLADVAAATTRGVVVLDVDGETTQLYGSSHALLIGNSDYTAGHERRLRGFHRCLRL